MDEVQQRGLSGALSSPQRTQRWIKLKFQISIGNIRYLMVRAHRENRGMPSCSTPSHSYALGHYGKPTGGSQSTYERGRETSEVIPRRGRNRSRRARPSHEPITAPSDRGFSERDSRLFETFKVVFSTTQHHDIYSSELFGCSQK